MLATNTREQEDLVRRLSILFVEDDDDVRENMARYLERRVAKVHTAHNGLAGLNSFKEIHPDLVISDIRMGGMDGLTMCRTIRESAPDLPVIIISAHNESEVLLSSINMGVTKFIVKPVDTNVLMDSITSVAKSLDQQRSLASKLQQMNLMRNESDYESESVKSYVARYLEAGHHDELTNIKHLSIPKLELSGDFYSVAQNRGDLYVMLADGAGHGLSAVIPALQMPRIFQQQAERGFSLLTIAAELNRLLHEQNFVGHFVATTLIRINSGERYIEVLNCGNPPVLLIDDDGMLLRSCHSKSTALGMVGDQEFSAEAEHFGMDRNARIYLFTDGLTDTLQALSPECECHDELHAVFGNVSALNVFDSVVNKIERAARQSLVDDITLLEISYDSMPQSEISTESGIEPIQPREEAQPVSLSQMTMLYVEDDEVTRDYLELYLNRRLGMVHIAKDGREGLELFKKYRPHIVLSDIKMPMMDGLEMAQEIRRLDKDVPLILISGSDNAEDAEKMFEMGVSRFHMKPLDPNKLMKTVHACIQQANALDQLRLSSSAFQTSSLAVLTADKDKKIITVNPSFSRITGYGIEEVVGHNPTLLISGNHDVGYFQGMWHALDESGSWSGEMLCRHKNGTTVSEWLTVNAVSGADGNITGYHFIFSDISQHQMNEEKVRQLTLHDSLTHLPNREMFADQVNELLSQGRQRSTNPVLIYINIDQFIEINNLLGVRVGDEVLLAVAKRLTDSAGESTLVCRLGGDEFAVLMLGDGGYPAIERAVVELSGVISQPIFVSDQEIQLRLSIGISLFPSDGENYEELVKSACSAMNQAQLGGGNTYRFFDKSANQREERHAVLQQGIKGGLQRKEFYMLYQPKYSLSQKRVIGAEALVRWNHPTLGAISPVEFIPLAEGNGSVIEMSEWIIDTVCSQLAEWRSKGLSIVPVSINISPVHFWRGDLVGALQSGLTKWGINPEMLPIEVTEGVVMDTSEKTLQVLANLKSLGFHLSIDDFGTGYSSLRYLKDLPISELKIDRSFIIEIPEVGTAGDFARTAIPRAIIRLASELNLAVVAEGVETEHQRDFLSENGCDVIQGYLFSRPISADEFAGTLT